MIATYYNTQIEIFDITGKCILSQTLLNTNSSINITSFAKGFYFLKIKTKETHYTILLMKE
ncbi:MAG: T9SS type A sorting domain-containing protein [Bacteroidales bacterium]